MADTSSYLLAGGSAELERLRLQARVWEPEAEALLDRMGVQAGWRCVDLGCGAMGILGPLSRRVGPQGHVIGVDTDATQLAAARAFVQEHHLDNVEVFDQDAYHTTLPRASFDCTHVRFVRHNAEKYHINPAYLGGVGGSSGAHLLSLMGTLEGSGNGADPDPVNRHSARLQCIVARAAPLDLLQMAPTNIADALALFLGLRIVSQTQAEGSQGYRKAWMASPINHVTADAAPFLLIHGDADQAVPLKQSEMMEEALRKVNVPAKLIRIPKGGHGPAFPGGQIPDDLNAEIVTWLDTHLQKHASSR